MKTKHIGAIIAGVITLLTVGLSFSDKFQDIQQNPIFIIFYVIVFTMIGGTVGEMFGNGVKKPKKPSKTKKKEDFNRE